MGHWHSVCDLHSAKTCHHLERDWAGFSTDLSCYPSPIAVVTQLAREFRLWFDHRGHRYSVQNEAAVLQYNSCHKNQSPVWTKLFTFQKLSNSQGCHFWKRTFTLVCTLQGSGLWRLSSWVHSSSASLDHFSRVERLAHGAWALLKVDLQDCLHQSSEPNSPWEAVSVTDSKSSPLLWSRIIWPLILWSNLA